MGRKRGDEEVAGLFKLLSCLTRLRILRLLEHDVGAEGVPVADVCAHVGMSQPAVSHHLALLRACGAVEAVKDGRFRRYALTEVGRVAAAAAAGVAEAD